MRRVKRGAVAEVVGVEVLFGTRIVQMQENKAVARSEQACSPWCRDVLRLVRLALMLVLTY